jgi:two-component system chemotaxis response regulator CheB
VANRDIFVIGSSLGGVEALMRLLAELPSDFSASLFIVQHTSPRAGNLDKVLARRARLPLHHARDGEPFERGAIYLAPPDRHLLLEPKTVRVVRGPRENCVRPAIDPLFRSAAAHYGPRVVGVVLTGLRDDGTAGLQAIHRSGGITVVQDPEDAAFPDMPRTALAQVPVDHVVPLARMPELLSRLASETAPESPSAPEDIVREARITAGYTTSDDPLDRLGELTTFNCPECEGPLWEIDDADRRRYRCRIGHAFSEEVVSELQTDQIERSLLVALRTLEERSRMLGRLVQRARDVGGTTDGTQFERERDEALVHIEVLKELLGSLT